MNDRCEHCGKFIKTKERYMENIHEDSGCCQPVRERKPPMSEDKWITMWIALAMMFIVGSIVFYNVYTNKIMFEQGYSEVYVPGAMTKAWQKAGK
jgi:hypothetical protein